MKSLRRVTPNPLVRSKTNPFAPRHMVGHGWPQRRGFVGAPSMLVGANTLVGDATQLQGAQNASLVQNGPTQGRRQNLGFPIQNAVAAGADAQAESPPQTWFRPDRLFIASAVGASFVVDSVLVGNKQQFVNAEPCPAAMFSELAVNADVEYDTCEPAVTITVNLTNISAAATSVTPGMTGRSAY